MHGGSNHHPRIKSGIVKCLAHRARTVCSKDTVEKELNHLQGVFESNNYPPSLVSKHLHQRKRKLANNIDDETEKQHLLVTPYVKGLSENIERRCKHINVKTVFSSKRTLRSELVNVKKRIDLSDRKGVVYEIECGCGHSYIGETGRTLNTRIKEHKYAVRRYDPNNGISVHANATMHNMKWEDARIIGVEENTLKRKHKESLCIAEKAGRQLLNLDCGLQVHPSWINCINP